MDAFREAVAAAVEDALADASLEAAAAGDGDVLTRREHLAAWASTHKRFLWRCGALALNAAQARFAARAARRAAEKRDRDLPKIPLF